MKKAGGIVALIAGIFGTIAAGVTLFVGGVGSALEAEGASTVVGLGWGGVLFSFLTIIFGAVAIGAHSRWPGVILILCALAGAILGGSLVAIFMVLAAVGGILAVMGKSPPKGSQAATTLVLCLIAVWAYGYDIQQIEGNRNKDADQAGQDNSQTKDERIAELERLLEEAKTEVEEKEKAEGKAKNSEDQVRDAVIKRCRRQMGSYGSAMVKSCVDMDMEAYKALLGYKAEYKAIIDRCKRQMSQYGWAMVQSCADMDIEAEESLSDY